MIGESIGNSRLVLGPDLFNKIILCTKSLGDLVQGISNNLLLFLYAGLAKSLSMLRKS